MPYLRILVMPQTHTAITQISVIDDLSEMDKDLQWAKTQKYSLRYFKLIEVKR